MKTPKYVHFSRQAWQDYIYWRRNQPTTSIQIRRLIDTILKNPSFHQDPDPHPETTETTPTPHIPLDGILKGWNSITIDETHRFIYQYHEETLIILQCRHHH